MIFYKMPIHARINAWSAPWSTLQRHFFPATRAGFRSCEAPSNCDSTWRPNRPIPKHYINNFIKLIFLYKFGGPLESGGPQALLLLLLCKSATACYSAQHVTYYMHISLSADLGEVVHHTREPSGLGSRALYGCRTSFFIKLIIWLIEIPLFCTCAWTDRNPHPLHLYCHCALVTFVFPIKGLSIYIYL